MTSHPPGIRIVLISGSVQAGQLHGQEPGLGRGRNRETLRDCVGADRSCQTEPSVAREPTATPAMASRLRELVSRATGVILATPEYHGSFSSVIKLVIENLGFPSVLAGKPIALLGVAAGQIGAIKAIEGLASVCSHVGAIVLPGPVSVANVQRVFDAEGRCLDPGVEKRVRSVASNLIDYIHGAICPRIAMEAMARGGAK